MGLKVLPKFIELSQKGKIYFLSDSHLGAESNIGSLERERKLCRWLDSVWRDASAIYLLGDIFDYWFEYRYVVPKGFTRVLGKLAEITDSGVEVHFFVGNHDLWLTDYLSVECGVTIHFEPAIVEIYGKRFFLAHGDGLNENSAAFRFLRKVFRSRPLQRCFSSIHPRWTVPLGRGWSLRSRLLGGTGSYQGEANEPLVLFAKDRSIEDPLIDYFIFGHRHIMLDLSFGEGKRLLILGDWISIFSYALFDGESIRLERWEE